MNQIPLVAQPENFKIQLFKHQLAAIYKMEKREKLNKINEEIKTKIGIYSDITGYGKTCSIIGLLIRDKMEWDMNTMYCLIQETTFGSNMIKTIHKTYYKKVNCSLIIANQVFNTPMGERVG